jgi:hypothetical protein
MGRRIFRSNFLNQLRFNTFMYALSCRYKMFHVEHFFNLD